jgi:hypothetical protein
MPTTSRRFEMLKIAPLISAGRMNGNAACLRLSIAVTPSEPKLPSVPANTNENRNTPIA